MSEEVAESVEPKPIVIPPGARKAALWLLSVPESTAVETLRYLDPDEVQTIGLATRILGETTPDETQTVHQEFQEMADNVHLLVRGGFNYLESIAHEALGETADEVLHPLEETNEPTPVPLRETEAELVASTLKSEHPQVVAAVISSLEAPHAAQILDLFPEELRQPVLMRVAELKAVPKHALNRAEEVLAGSLPLVSGKRENLDGIRVAASILNRIDTDDAQDMLDEIAEQAEETAAQIKLAMFTFEDLVGLDRKGFQTLLKEVQSDQLLVALKTASDAMRDNVFASLSKRAADMLKDDLDLMGPVRVSDVETAQQEIVAVAMRLRGEGKLNIAGGSGDEYV